LIVFFRTCKFNQASHHRTDVVLKTGKKRNNEGILLKAGTGINYKTSGTRISVCMFLAGLEYRMCFPLIPEFVFLFLYQNIMRLAIQKYMNSSDSAIRICNLEIF